MASQVQRELERNLILPDQYLTNETIDELWGWFCNATREQVDLQLVFVKLLNSAREPYLKHLSVEQPSSSNGHFESKINTCYTPSECTVMEQCSEVPSSGTRTNITKHDLQRKLVDITTELTAKSNAIQKLEHQLDQERKADEERYRALEIKTKPVRVAIESAEFPSRYLSLNASGVRSYNEAGGGKSSVRPSIGAWETFELIQSPDGKGIVHFKSTAFEDVYLRADASTVHEASVKEHVNGGTVNAQYGYGKLEQFRIISLSNRRVVIESVAFPGRYVRMQVNEDVVNMQGITGNNREFYLVIVM